MQKSFSDKKFAECIESGAAQLSVDLLPKGEHFQKMVASLLKESSEEGQFGHAPLDQQRAIDAYRPIQNFASTLLYFTGTRLSNFTAINMRLRRTIQECQPGAMPTWYQDYNGENTGFSIYMSMPYALHHGRGVVNQFHLAGRKKAEPNTTVEPESVFDYDRGPILVMQGGFGNVTAKPEDESALHADFRNCSATLVILDILGAEIA